MQDFERFVRELTRSRGRRRDLGPENWAILESVPSTNGLARRLIADYEGDGLDPVPAWLLAFAQTAGKGRGENRWASPAGAGVYASRILPVPSAGLLQTLPILAGLGLCRALSPLLASPCRLKWPNDLVVAAPAAASAAEAPAWRKIGGILIEAAVQPGEGGSAAVVGFGVNHRADEALPAEATSAAAEGAGLGLAELAWELVAGIERELPHLGDAGYAVQGMLEASIHRPGDRLVCRVGGERVEGLFQGFDEHGFLRLETQGKERVLSAAEVIES